MKAGEYASFAGNSWFKRFEEDLQFSNSSMVDLNKKAGFWIRTVAFLIDTIVLNLVYTIFFLTGGLAIYLASGIQDWFVYLDQAAMLYIPYNILMLGITIGYFTYLHSYTGQTVGKMICNLKVVQENGEALTYGKSFLRVIGYFLSTIALNLGFLWVAFDRKKQGLHDKIAGTYVIRLEGNKKS